MARGWVWARGIRELFSKRGQLNHENVHSYSHGQNKHSRSAGQPVAVLELTWFETKTVILAVIVHKITLKKRRRYPMLGNR